MERFSRILIIIFILTLANLGLNSYLLSKINKLQTITKATPIVISSPLPSSKVTSKPVSTDTNNIANDISIIKAEIRSIRDSLELTGITVETTPKP